VVDKDVSPIEGSKVKNKHGVAAQSPENFNTVQLVCSAEYLSFPPLLRYI
jgi:hypothetical protein